MRKILLTGGSGFIGRNILEQLGGEYWFCAPGSKELDLLDRQAVRDYMEKNEVTDVIHCAVFDQKRRESLSGTELQSNLKMFYHLAEHAGNLNKFIYFGSGAEFDKRRPIQMAKEEDFGRTVPMQNDYSLSKYLMNFEARNSSNIYNLRLFGVFGKYEDWTSCFISNLCCKALFHLPLTIRKECIFDYLYIDDLMPVLRWILENGPLYHDYNVCSARRIRLTEIAQTVKEVSGRNLEIRLLSPGMNLEYTGSSSRIDQEFSFHNGEFRSQVAMLYDYYKRIQNEISAAVLEKTR